MGSTKKPKPPPPGANRLGGVPKKLRKLQKSPQARAADVQLQRQIFELTVRGMNARQISAQLNINRRRAARLVARALDEAMSDRDDLVQLYVAKGIVQADAIVSTYMPRARGYVKVDADGQPMRERDGTVMTVEPDPKAALICLRAIRDRNLLIANGATIKIEHTGAGGGPIMTAHIDARAAAAKVRERFANAPQVILVEGEGEGDVQRIAQGVPTGNA